MYNKICFIFCGVLIQLAAYQTFTYFVLVKGSEGPLIQQNDNSPKEVVLKPNFLRRLRLFCSKYWYKIIVSYLAPLPLVLILNRIGFIPNSKVQYWTVACFLWGATSIITFLPATNFWWIESTLSFMWKAGLVIASALLVGGVTILSFVFSI